MRLQLSLVLGLLAPAAAATELAARVDVYADSWIVVVAPSARTEVDLDARSVLSAGMVVNTVSGATPVLADTISSATRFTARRLGWDAAATRTIGRALRLTGGASASLEEDFVAHGVLLGVVGDLPGDRIRLSADLRLRAESVTPATGEPLLDRGAGQDLELSWTQILGPRTRASLMVSGFLHQCGPHFGCQANPYRYVRVDTPDGPTALREHHPSRRARLAAALRLSQALGRDVAVHGGYRFYADTWGITAHTADLALAVSLLGERLLLRGFGRFTWQGPATFARGTQPGALPAFRTADREIGGLWDLHVGGRVEVAVFAAGPFGRLAPSVRVAHATYRYRGSQTSPRRDAWLIGGGLDATF